MLKPEHKLIITAFVARVKATKFSSAKQFKEFHDELAKSLATGVVPPITATLVKATAAQKREAAAKRKRVRCEARTAWCKANLKAGDSVSVDGMGTDVFNVASLSQPHEDHDVKLLRVIAVGYTSEVMATFGELKTVMQDGVMKDIYKLATGAK